MTPSVVWIGSPWTMTEARQLVIRKIIPTERSSPPVRTGMVWAMATRASRAPLFAAVLTMPGDSPTSCFKP